MSIVGLQEAERMSQNLQKKLKSTLAKQQKEIQQEINKIEYLLNDKQALRNWRTNPADSSRIAQLLSQLDEVERLYLEAGDTTAARIFKERMTKELKRKLTNLEANKVEVKLRAQQFKAATQPTMLQDFTTIKREAAIRELYLQSRESGGFLSNIGRPFMRDLITLETKAAGSKTLGEYMTNLYNTYEKKLKDVFVSGIIRGDSYQKMAQNLMNTSKVTAGKANLLIKTEANAIFNDSVRTVIQKNPLVKGYRFRAVLDNKTSKLCQEHDGKFIPKENMRPGVNYPPLHPNCRSTVTTVLVTEDEKKDRMQRYTKNGSNEWEPVPVGMHYQEFKDKFGFADNSKPRTYRVINNPNGEQKLAKIDAISYKGYVKPSVSATKTINKMIDAYIDGDDTFINKVKENTGLSQVDKALFRQAQAETGFDGLPLKLNSNAFEKEIKKKGYKRLYRQFSGQDTVDEFLNGVMPYGNGKSNYGVGTYTFETRPEDGLYSNTMVEMALKSDDSKILKIETDFDSQLEIVRANTGDSRIDDILLKAPQMKRKEILSLAAAEYGYDAIEVTNSLRGKYMLILNRTAVIVKGD